MLTQVAGNLPILNRSDAHEEVNAKPREEAVSVTAQVTWITYIQIKTNLLVLKYFVTYFII